MRAAGERAALEFRQESELLRRSKNMAVDAQTRCVWGTVCRDAALHWVCTLQRWHCALSSLCGLSGRGVTGRLKRVPTSAFPGVLAVAAAAMGGGRRKRREKGGPGQLSQASHVPSCGMQRAP